MYFATTTLLAILGTASASPLTARAAPADLFTGQGNIFPGRTSGDFESVLTEAGTLTVNDNNAGTFTAVRKGESVTLSTAAGTCGTDASTGTFACGAGIAQTTYQIESEPLLGSLQYILTVGGEGNYRPVSGGSPSGSDTVALALTEVNDGESQLYQFTWNPL